MTKKETKATIANQFKLAQESYKWWEKELGKATLELAGLNESFDSSSEEKREEIERRISYLSQKGEFELREFLKIREKAKAAGLYS